MTSNFEGNATGNGSDKLSTAGYESLFALRAQRLKQKASDLAKDLESLTDLVKQDVGQGFNSKVRQFEIGLIKAALMQAGGNQQRAAKLLDLKPTTLNYKIRRYGIGIAIQD
jgi:transcriptional regulator with GAF, ATPase, and Fis domain